jgi:predicted acylesterase/phospholipase RssA
LIDRLVAIADGCGCNPLYSQRLMRCVLGIPTVLVLDGAGEVHVDGGVLNNLSVDRARALSAGRVIALTLDAEAQPSSGVPSIPKAIVDSMMCASHANSLQVEAQASLMLRPDVCSYSFLD